MSLLSRHRQAAGKAPESERQRKQHQIAWVGVLGIGSVLIAAGRVVGFEQWVGGWFLAIFLSVLMGVYFWSASSAKHVSADTKGDAFYYLGLLFTFGSLVSALVGISADGGANDIRNTIAPFGIALLTTIVGLSGRVWFSVWQESPGDAVVDATKALDEAIVDMKDIVLRGSQGMEDLVDNLGASAKAMEGTALRIASVAEKAAGTAAALDEYSERVTRLGQSFSEGATEFAGAVTGTAAGVSSLKESLEETRSLLDTLGRNLVVLVDTVDQARASVSQLDRAGRAGEREVAGIASRAEDVQRDMERIQVGFAKTAELFVDAKHTATTIDDHAARIGSSVGGLAGEVSKLQEAAVTAADAMTKVAPALGKSLSELSDVASRGREAVSSRVQDLEERLDGVGTEAATAVGRASGRADSVAGDMDKLRDQLTETQKELFQITRDSTVVAKELRRRTRDKSWWEKLLERRGRRR